MIEQSQDGFQYQQAQSQQITRTKTGISFAEILKASKKDEIIAEVVHKISHARKFDKDECEELLNFFSNKRDELTQKKKKKKKKKKKPNGQFIDSDCSHSSEEEDSDVDDDSGDDQNQIFDRDGKNSEGRLLLRAPLDLADKEALQSLPQIARDPTKWDKRELEVPLVLAERLQEYQREGVKFLHRLYARHLGGLLADDMGLGKTLQCIAFVIACLMAKEPRKETHMIDHGGKAKLMFPNQDAGDEGIEMWDDEDLNHHEHGAQKNKKCANDDDDDNDNNNEFSERNENLTRYDKWGNPEQLSTEEAKEKGVNEKNRRPILIIVPATLIDNWRKEFKKWGEDTVGDDWDITVAVAHGSERETVLDDIEKHGGIDVLITTAGIVQKDIASNPENNVWTKTSWDFCIIDEVHTCFKNSKNEAYIAMKQLKCLIFGLTGTPYQNKPTELHALFDLVNFNCLGRASHFENYYSRPMTKARNASASKEEIGLGKDRAKKLKSLLDIYMIKRMKSEVLKEGTMKKKTDKVVFCDLAPLQRRAYERLRASTCFQLILTKDDPCDCGSGEKRTKCCYPVDNIDGDEMWMAYGDPILGHAGHGGKCPTCCSLACVIAARNVSNHLELLKPGDLSPNANPYDHLVNQRARAVAKVALGDEQEELGGLHQQRNFLEASAFKNCGKMKTLKILLERFYKKNDKVILFSYSVKLLDIIQEFVKARGYVYKRLDGGTDPKLRQPIVDEFNSDRSCFLFLMSTRAGGMGINVTSANKVVIFDPNWNPAIDLQAQDRAYRLGQKRDVDVYRLISAGTLEELVYSRQIYKQQMGSTMTDGKTERRYFDGVQGGGKEQRGELWGIGNLLKLDGAGQVMMRDKVEAEKNKKVDDNEYIKDEEHRGEDGFNFKIAKAPEREKLAEIGKQMLGDIDVKAAAAGGGDNIFDLLTVDEDGNEQLKALHIVDHNKLLGADAKELHRVEEAEEAHNNEELVQRMALKQKQRREGLKPEKGELKRKNVDPNDPLIQDMLLCAMAKRNKMSELAFAKQFLSLNDDEERQYFLDRNVEKLRGD